MQSQAVGCVSFGPGCKLSLGQVCLLPWPCVHPLSRQGVRIVAWCIQLAVLLYEVPSWVRGLST